MTSHGAGPFTDATTEQRELMRALAHDLRTPLMVARASIEFVEETMPQSPETLAALIDATSAIAGMCALVDDALLMSRIVQPEPHFERSNFLVQPLIARVTDFCSGKAATRAVELATRSDAISMDADAMLLRRVLETLVDTFLQHTPGGGRVSLDAVQPTEARVTFTVSRSPSANDATLHDLLVGAAPVGRHRRRPGSLALDFCKRAIEAHGGRFGLAQSPISPVSLVIDLPVR